MSPERSAWMVGTAEGRTSHRATTVRRVAARLAAGGFEYELAALMSLSGPELDVLAHREDIRPCR